MPRRSTKTVTTPEEHIDVDGDGDVDAVVSHTTTITIEDEPDAGGVTPMSVGVRAAGDPGECGENACWSRTVLTFTDQTAGLLATLTPDWQGNIVWDFGDGSDPVMGRGPVQHTYAGAGTYTVTATPVASSCFKAGSASVTVA
jgi:PKD repeat protein